MNRHHRPDGRAASSTRSGLLAGMAAIGILTACAGRAVDPGPEPAPEPQAAAVALLREGPIDWDGSAGAEGEEVVADSVIAVGGGAGGSFGGRAGGRARADGEPLPAAAMSPPSSSPPSEDFEAGLRALGYDGSADEVAELRLGEVARGNDDFAIVAGQASDGGEPVATWQRSTSTPNTSRLLVGENDSLPLEGASTEVWVEGFRARVVVDLVYRNDRDRQLEGTFQLRLPDGASPYYLAFGAETWESAPPTEGWIPRRDEAQRATSGSSPEAIAVARAPFWAGVKEARMVPRDRGALAYEQTVARQVDPALMEWAGAGVFRAKVFPLVPGELHRIVLGYELDLLRTGADSFELALGLADVTPHPVDLHLDLPAGAHATVGDDPRRYGGERGASEHIAVDGAARGSLVLRVGDLSTPLLSTPGAAGRGLFATTLRPALAGATATAPDRAVILLDTSRSAADGYATWMALLEALLSSDVAPREFALLGFDAGQAWLTDGFVPNTDAERRRAVATAEGQWLAGATDLAGALSAATRPDWWRGAADWDLFLLGDGSATWGEADAARIAAVLDRAPNSSLFAYRTGQAGADTPLLERLASRSGGAVFTVAGESAVEAAARAHASTPWALVDVRVDGASDLLVAGRPRFLYPDQALTIVGRGAPTAGATLELDLERGGGITTHRVVLDQAHAGQLAERCFGQIAVAQLEELDPASRREAEDLALHFRVPGSTCSLLMLETEAEYESYGLGERDTSGVAADLAVAARVAELWAEAGALLTDPRARLAGLLERLADLPNVRFEGAAEIVAALGGIEPDLLTVTPEPLATTRAVEDVAEALRTAVAAAELEEAQVREATAAEAGAGRLSSADQLRALSTVAETHAGEPAAARELGYDALALGYPGHAYHQLLRAAEARPFEPSTYLALAEAAADAGRLELAWIWFEVALGGQWDGRFGDFHQIAAVSCLHWLRTNAGDLPTTVAQRLRDSSKSIADGAGFAEADMVVFVQWSTDRTDVDLHVLEPSGEHCFYSHKITAQGGRLSTDVTRGLGPEMFVLPTGEPGDYGIGVHYFASDRNKTDLRTRVHVSVYRDFGRPTEAHERRTLTLDDAGGLHDVGILTL